VEKKTSTSVSPLSLASSLVKFSCFAPNYGLYSALPDATFATLNAFRGLTIRASNLGRKCGYALDRPARPSAQMVDFDLLVTSNTFDSRSAVAFDHALHHPITSVPLRARRALPQLPVLVMPTAAECFDQHPVDMPSEITRPYRTHLGDQAAVQKSIACESCRAPGNHRNENARRNIHRRAMSRRRECHHQQWVSISCWNGTDMLLFNRAWRLTMVFRHRRKVVVPVCFAVQILRTRPARRRMVERNSNRFKHC